MSFQSMTGKTLFERALLQTGKVQLTISFKPAPMQTSGWRHIIYIVSGKEAQSLQRRAFLPTDRLITIVPQP